MAIIAIAILFFHTGFLDTVTAATKIPEQSEYSGQIKSCIEKTKNGTAKTEQGYICPGGSHSNQWIAYQVVLDLEFKKIDKDVEADIATLQSSSTKSIGEITQKITDWFDSTAKNSNYRTRYEQVCNDISSDTSVIGQTIKHFGSLTTDNGTPDFIEGQSTCGDLVNKKIAAYRDTAWLVAEGSVVKSYQKDKHDYMTKLKDIYEKFLNKWTTLIGQLGRIKDKWPSKTPNVQ